MQSCGLFQLRPFLVIFGCQRKIAIYSLRLTVLTLLLHSLEVTSWFLCYLFYSILIYFPCELYQHLHIPLCWNIHQDWSVIALYSHSQLASHTSSHWVLGYLPGIRISLSCSANCCTKVTTFRNQECTFGRAAMYVGHKKKVCKQGKSGWWPVAAVIALSFGHIALPLSETCININTMCICQHYFRGYHVYSALATLSVAVPWRLFTSACFLCLLVLHASECRVMPTQPVTK